MKNPYLAVLGWFAVILIVGGVVQASSDEDPGPVSMLTIGLLLAVLWLVVKAVRHPAEDGRPLANRAVRRAGRAWNEVRRPDQ